MSSLYLKVLVWSIATVMAAMLGLFIHSAMMPMRAGGPPFQNGRILADVARRIYAKEGREALRELVRDAGVNSNSEFYVTDDQGRDLVTNEDRSSLLAERPSSRPRLPFPMPPPARFVLVAPSSDGSVRWVTVLKLPPPGGASASEAFVWILAAVAILAYLFTVYLVSPLRKLAGVVERFGAGDLNARAETKRRDELGNLARAFDQMAERIDTLVTTERRLLQDISHELRTPLARMRFAVEVARTDPNHEGALDRIRKECDRLALLTDELLEIGVADGDPGGRHMEQGDLAELIAETVEDSAMEAAGRGVQLELRTPPAAELKMDRELLRRAVENVLRNAIRYSPDGAIVGVELTAVTDGWQLSIRDRGPGVPPAALEKIFLPFFRADNHRARKADSGGVGLGLAIARRAALWHNGTLRAENAEPGLRVLLHLPRTTA